MMNTIRAYTLRAKKVCEAYESPIPLKVRVVLHAFGRRVYHWTYGLTPEEAEKIFSGKKDVPPEKVIFSNYCMTNYGNTLNSDGSQSHHWCIEDSALLSIMALQALNGNWRRMLEVNGIWLESLDGIEHSRDTAKRYDLLVGTKFYYLEPREDVDPDQIADFDFD